MVNETTDQKFEQDTAKGLTLTDFGASWCGPCHMEAPIIAQLAKDLGDKAKVYKMDVDANPKTAQKLGIMGIPTMVVKKDGQIVDRLTGVHSEDQLKTVLAKHA
ncbi:MAG: thioredoxin [Acetilactobacillus jinshanensis]